MQSTPFIADTVGTSRVYFSQMSVIYFCQGFSCSLYYRGVLYSEVSAGQELAVHVRDT